MEKQNQNANSMKINLIFFPKNKTNPQRTIYI